MCVSTTKIRKPEPNSSKIRPIVTLRSLLFYTGRARRASAHRPRPGRQYPRPTRACPRSPPPSRACSPAAILQPMTAAPITLAGALLTSGASGHGYPPCSTRSLRMRPSYMPIVLLCQSISRWVVSTHAPPALRSRYCSWPDSRSSRSLRHSAMSCSRRWIKSCQTDMRKCLS
jgi:hypothetical protein